MTCKMHLYLVSGLTEALNARRIADGTQPDKVAARQLDVETSTYQRWRTGRAIPGDEHVPAIADWLGVSVGEVYTLLGEARRERKTATPPPTLEDRVVELETQFADLKDAVMKLLGTPAQGGPMSPDPPSDRTAARPERRSGRAS